RFVAKKRERGEKWRGAHTKKRKNRGPPQKHPKNSNRQTEMGGRHPHKPPPPQILAYRRRCRRAAILALHCQGASLSNQTGAHCRGLRAGRRDGHIGAPPWPVADGAVRSAIRG